MKQTVLHLCQTPVISNLTVKYEKPTPHPTSWFDIFTKPLWPAHSFHIEF